MQDKKKIIAEHKKIISIIKKHNNSYYIYDNPTISDSEFDKIKIHAIQLEKKYPYLKKIDSIQNIVGAKPLNKFKKVKHLSPMLSLSNAFNLNDMADFKKKINNFLSLKNNQIEFFCEPKIDGISATLIYENGNLIRGLSRGTVDQRYHRKLKTIKGMPKKIIQRMYQLLRIRCEIYISKKIFQKLKKSLQIQEMLQRT